MITIFCLLATGSLAQDSTMISQIEDEAAPEPVSGAFKSTRVINAHSIEMLAKGNLDFRIMHRFGFVSDGIRQFFGLDAASMRMSFDYGITNHLSIGIGRSTFRKELDGFIKARLVQQTKGTVRRPFSVIIAAGSTMHTEQYFTTPKPSTVQRLGYYVQLVAGRKFSRNFSMQLSPIFVHTNLPATIGDPQGVFAMGLGARYAISPRTAITFDYHHPFASLAESTDPLSLGLDISTGGHTFQLQFSNSTGMNERAYITQTTGNFFKGDIRFGFNLSRIFRVGGRW